MSLTNEDRTSTSGFARLRRTTSKVVFGPAAVALTAFGSCTGDNASEPGDPPLGWNGPIEAPAVRSWSLAGMDSAPRWTVADAPVFAAAPDSLDASSRQRGLQSVSDGAFLPDGSVVLLYGRTMRDSVVLLHFLDPVGGTESRIPAPRGDDRRALDWARFRMAVWDRGLILLGDNGSRGRQRTGRDIWHADLAGSFLRPPSFTGVEGELVGVLSDGSLVVRETQGWPDAAGELLLYPMVVVRTSEPDGGEVPGDSANIAFKLGVPVDPARPGSDWPAFWTGFLFSTTVVAGDWIWVVPTERPELFAVDRSGDVLLKVEWDGGDLATSPEAAAAWEGFERIPAAVDVKAGTDGRIYVRRTVPGSRSTQGGPEWLVFSQDGELVARLNVPTSLRVLAFGNSAVLVVADSRTASSRDEIRVYELRLAGDGN